jgi:hypothetical protein
MRIKSNILISREICWSLVGFPPAEKGWKRGMAFQTAEEPEKKRRVCGKLNIDINQLEKELDWLIIKKIPR